MGTRSSAKLLGLTVAGASLIARVAAANVFVTDRRMQDDGSRPPFRSVGVLRHPSIGLGGTAFLVSSCHIATAYHVAFQSLESVRTGDVTRRKPGDEAEFLVGLDPKQASRFAAKSRARVVAFGRFSAKNFQGMAGDWAILRLDDCLGRKYGYLRYAREQSGPMPSGALMAIGFPASRSGERGVAVETGCKARDYGPVADLIGVDCAFENGMSGGPILERQGDGTWLTVGLIQQSMSPVNGILPQYSMEHRNQMLSVAAFRKAITEALKADAKRLLAERSK
jgi:hypothetical protein